MAGVASASAAPLPAAPSNSLSAARSPPTFLPLRARRPRVGPVLVLATGRGRTYRAEAIRTRRERAEQETEVAAVQESFPVREAAGTPEGAAAADEDPLAPADEVDGWVVRFEQQFNIFLTDSIIVILEPHHHYS